MADNLQLNLGSGGSILAADDIASVFYQRVKITYGVDGSATDVSDSNPLPIDDAGGSITVDNAGTFAVQVDGDALTALQLIDDAVHTDDAAFTLGSGKGMMMMGFAGTQSVNANDAAALACDTDGALHISDGGNTITVDGTVTANAGTGTFTVDGSGVTQPVSGTVTANLSATDNAVLDSINSALAGTLTVTGGGGGTEYTEDAAAPANPVGTATVMERDDALGGITPIAGDWSHQFCNANGALWTAVDGTVTVDGSGVTQPVSGTVDLGATDNAVLDSIAANTANLTNCIVQDDAPFTPATGYLMMVGGEFDDAGTDSVDEGDAGNIRISANRNMYVQLRDAAGNERGLNVDANGDIGITNTDLGTIAGDTTSIDGKMTAGEGVKGAAVQRVTVATDDTLVTNSTAILADTANMDTNLGTVAGAVSGSEMQVDVVGALPAGTNAIGKLAANSGVVIGDVNLGATDNAVLDTIVTNTNKGTSHYRNIDANAEAAIKGSAGTLHWIHAMNLTAALAYVHLYDATTASVTPGTTTPDFTFPLPTQGDTNGAGFTLRLEQAFANAITLVVTTTTDGSTGDPGTNGVFINAGYT